jgi:hypothetical protein
MPPVLQHYKGAKYRGHTGKFSPDALPLDEHAILPPACLQASASVAPKEKKNATITRSPSTAISIEPQDGLTTPTGKVQPKDDLSSLTVLVQRSASAIQVALLSHMTAPSLRGAQHRSCLSRRPEQLFPLLHSGGLLPCKFVRAAPSLCSYVVPAPLRPGWLLLRPNATRSPLPHCIKYVAPSLRLLLPLSMDKVPPSSLFGLCLPCSKLRFNSHLPYHTVRVALSLQSDLDGYFPMASLDCCFLL